MISIEYDSMNLAGQQKMRWSKGVNGKASNEWKQNTYQEYEHNNYIWY